MTEIEVLWLAAAFLAIAALYSTVGHGGASGYLMVMGLAGLAPQVMKPTALILNLIVAGIATARFARAGAFRWSILWPFAITSVPGAYLGGRIDLDPSIYRQLVGVVLVFAAFRLAWRMPGRGEQEPLRPVPLAVGLLAGAAIGVLSGLVGVGGGIFLSPFLLLCGWATARQTAGVSAPFIVVNSASGLAGFVSGSGGPPISAVATAVFAAAVMAGGLAGTWLGTRRLGHVGLRRVLAVVLVTAGLKMVIAPGSPTPTPPPAEPRST